MQKLLWPLALFGGAALYSKFKRPAQGEQAEEQAPAGEAGEDGRRWPVGGAATSTCSQCDATSTAR